MRFVAVGAFALALALSATVASAEDARPTAAASAYNTSQTSIGALLDDPAAKEILTKHLPALVASPQIEMARGMTLKDTQQFAPTMVTDEALAKIDADLAKLPPKK